MANIVLTHNGVTYDEKITDRHYAAVGRLINNFSYVDLELVSIFRKLSGATSTKAKILQGGTRPSDLDNTIRKLFETEKPAQEQLDIMDFLFTCVGELKKVRDSVAHLPFAVSGDKLYFTDAFTSKTAAAREMHATIKELDECADYCTTLTMALSLTYSKLPHSPHEHPDLHKTFTVLTEHSRHTLLKKPPLLLRENSRRQNKIPKQQRPLRSSRA